MEVGVNELVLLRCYWVFGVSLVLFFVNALVSRLVSELIFLHLRSEGGGSIVDEEVEILVTCSDLKNGLVNDIKRDFVTTEGDFGLGIEDGVVFAAAKESDTCMDVVLFLVRSQNIFENVFLRSQLNHFLKPGKSGVLVDGTLTGLELAVPHAIAARPMTNTCRQQVTYSLLDQNGHMNNTRYMDWLDDLLPSAFHKAHRARELTLCYMNEAREGDTVDLRFELTDGPTLTVDAQRENTGGADRIFSAQVLYDSVL